MEAVALTAVRYGQERWTGDDAPAIAYLEREDTQMTWVAKITERLRGLLDVVRGQQRGR